MTYKFRDENLGKLYENYATINISHCISCGKTDFENWAESGPYKAYKCLNCQLIFMNPQLNEDGLNDYYSNYLIFDEYPTERTYLYTHGGLLRDGEIHQTYRQGYSPETFAYYDIYETYEVSYESVILPLDNISTTDFPDETYTLDDVFKITRTKKTVMLGPDLEVVEENKVWLAKDIGIVKDEVSFRFNEPDDFDGFYKLELSQCNHDACCDIFPDNCGDSDFSGRSGFFDNRMEVDFNNLNTVDEFNDEYRKTRSYGIQTLPLNIE